MSILRSQVAVHVCEKSKNVKIHPDGSIEQSIITKDFSLFAETVLHNKKGHCYMLAVNSKDRKRLDSIIVHLLEKGFLFKVFCGLDASRLFISSENLRTLQKEIAGDKYFEKVKFILVRLNRSKFPKQRYC